MQISQKRVFYNEAACTYVNMRKYIVSQVSVVWYNTFIEKKSYNSKKCRKMQLL